MSSRDVLRTVVTGFEWLLIAMLGQAATDRVYAQSSNWQSNTEGWLITGDDKQRSCQGEANFQDGTKFRIGLIGPQKKIVFVFGKASWTDLRPKVSYKIRFVFDGGKTWNGDTIGAQMGSMPALLVEGVKDEFFSDFMAYNTLALFYNDRPIGALSLKGTSAALTEIKKCHEAVNAPSSTVQPFSGNSASSASTLNCTGPLSQASDIRTLESAFGSANVTARSKSIWPEYSDAPSVLYEKEAGRRVEVFWREQSKLRRPASIRLSEGSLWRVATTLPNVSISMNSTIEELERLNGRPFSLSAFAAVDGGMSTPASWRGGQLAQAAGGCAIYMYFRPSESAAVTDLAEVSGTGDLLSNSAALRRTRPVLKRLELYWPPGAGEERLTRLEKLLD